MNVKSEFSDSSEIFVSVPVAVEPCSVFRVDLPVFPCRFFIDQPGFRQFFRPLAQFFPAFVCQILIIVGEILLHFKKQRFQFFFCLAFFEKKHGVPPGGIKFGFLLKKCKKYLRFHMDGGIILTVQTAQFINKEK